MVAHHALCVQVVKVHVVKKVSHIPSLVAKLSRKSTMVRPIRMLTPVGKASR